jgi:hypothetical protein
VTLEYMHRVCRGGTCTIPTTPDFTRCDAVCDLVTVCLRFHCSEHMVNLARVIRESTLYVQRACVIQL